MTQRLRHIDDGIFTVADLFTREECAHLIERAEAIGFEAAAVRTRSGPQMMTHIRNNDRALLVDPELADEMWRRVQEFLPELDGRRPCGVDAQLRFYRYVPGQQFKRHKDGSATDDQGRASKLSYLVYLNDDCAGGSTTFRDYVERDGDRQEITFVVMPSAGTALLFRHERWHEGMPVSSGRKYVLRTDVFYESRPAEVK